MTTANFYSLIFSPSVSWDADDCRDSFAASAIFFTACRFFQFTAFGFAASDFVLLLPFILFGWISAAAMLHFFAHAAGGRGAVTDLFRLLPFAELPFLFLPAARILSGTLFAAFPGAFALLAVMIYVWSFALKVKVLMFHYRISSVGALAVFAAPAIVIFTLGAAALFLRAAIALI